MKFDRDSFLKSGSILSLSQDRLSVGWGEGVRGSRFDIDPSRPAYYLNDFFLNAPHPWVQYPHHLEIDRKSFHSLLQPRIKFRLEDCTWILSNPENYRRGFNSLFQLIQEGKLVKGVPYLFSRTSEQMEGRRLESLLYHGLASLDKRFGYLYGHWDSAHGVLGLTPEILFSRSVEMPQKISTMALAGTCSASASHEDFFHDPKERHEHQLVVEGIAQSLLPFGKLRIGEMELLKQPHLSHLMTSIDVFLDKIFDFESVVEAMHPTPALGAFPVVEGKKWLLEFQQHTPRRYYGAPIGYHCGKTGRAHCVVAIRNVQWHSEGMFIGGGGGVVKESVFEREWQEIQLKIGSIVRMFSG